jgi:hypothetical protein
LLRNVGAPTETRPLACLSWLKCVVRLVTGTGGVQEDEEEAELQPREGTFSAPPRI